MQSFRNLKVWQKAHALTVDVYKATNAFSKEELYGLTSQLRRASVSVGANIAEGSCRRGDADFGRFLQMAIGSASEVVYHVLLARDLEMLKTMDYQRLSAQVVEVKRMLGALLGKLRADG